MSLVKLVSSELLFPVVHIVHSREVSTIMSVWSNNNLTLCYLLRHDKSPKSGVWPHYPVHAGSPYRITWLEFDLCGFYGENKDIMPGNLDVAYEYFDF